jgi:Excreted virulence factor EspC, type VII ESX diderm
MPDGYEVLTGELDVHAAKVDGFADRLQTAVDAARQVTMDNGAYGVICQPFAMLLEPFEQMGVNALDKAAESVADTGAKVRDASRYYGGTETAEAATFRRTEV